MKFFFFSAVFYLCFLLCCSFFCQKKSKEVDFRVRAHQLSFQKARDLCRKHNLMVSGHGGAMFREIERISLAFNIEKELTKEEARILIIDIIGELIVFFNSQEELKPHYKNFPLTIENFSIMLASNGPKGERIYHPHYSWVANFGQIIKYITYSPENEYRPKTEEKETYEEALAIVRGEKKLSCEQKEPGEL